LHKTYSRVRKGRIHLMRSKLIGASFVVFLIRSLDIQTKKVNTLEFSGNYVYHLL
jgi:hypothetical protein